MMEPRVFDRMHSLADLVRGRILVLLERHGEFTVSELLQILQLPQSTVSRHLKVLSDDGWISSRPSGTSRHYRLSPDLDAVAKELWHIVRDEVADAARRTTDSERALAVMAERRRRSREFFSTTAGEWDLLRDELFGDEADGLPLFGLLDPGWVVGDLGAGTGRFSARIAPFVQRVVAVDASEEMRRAAARRLHGVPNADIRAGELEALPIEDGALDLAVLLLVLHYIVEPVDVLNEVHRALKPGGRLIIVDMRLHSLDGYQEEMGHVWPGFNAATLEAWHTTAGLADFSYRPLPVRPDASGPSLFAATSRLEKEDRMQPYLS